MKFKSSRSALLCLFLTLTSCSKQNPDAKLQEKLTGNWVLQSGLLPTNEFQSRISVDSLGNYLVHASITTESNTVRTFEIEGIYQIKGGYLIDTVTNHSTLPNNTYVPYFRTNRIVRLTDKQLIVDYSEATSETHEVIFRKEEK